MKTKQIRKNVVNNALIVFFKYPEIGYVKTRLGEEIGLNKAFNIYKALIHNTLNIVNSLSETDIYLIYTSIKKVNFNNFSCDKWKIFKQCEGDLGKKMKHGFQKVFDKDIKKIITIGTDIIGLTREIIEFGFDSLDENDIVIGPTYDGGYYLIGMKKTHDIFDNIQWGTDNVFEKTLEKIDKLGLKIKILPILYLSSICSN